MVTINVYNDLLNYVVRNLQVGRSQKFYQTDEKALMKEEEREQQLFACKVSVPVLNMGQVDEDRAVITPQIRKWSYPKHYCGNL